MLDALDYDIPAGMYGERVLSIRVCRGAEKKNGNPRLNVLDHPVNAYVSHLVNNDHALQMFLVEGNFGLADFESLSGVPSCMHALEGEGGKVICGIQRSHRRRAECVLKNVVTAEESDDFERHEISEDHAVIMNGYLNGQVPIFSPDTMIHMANNNPDVAAAVRRKFADFNGDWKVRVVRQMTMSLPGVHGIVSVEGYELMLNMPVGGIDAFISQGAFTRHDFPHIGEDGHVTSAARDAILRMCPPGFTPIQYVSQILPVIAFMRRIA